MHIQQRLSLSRYLVQRLHIIYTYIYVYIYKYTFNSACPLAVSSPAPTHNIYVYMHICKRMRTHVYTKMTPVRGPRT